MCWDILNNKKSVPLFVNPLIALVVIIFMINCREVEDFARRLNSDWPQRMQEILSLGQDRRLVRVSMNGNCSTRRCTSKLFLCICNTPCSRVDLHENQISALGH